MRSTTAEATAAKLAALASQQSPGLAGLIRAMKAVDARMELYSVLVTYLPMLATSFLAGAALRTCVRETRVGHLLVCGATRVLCAAAFLIYFYAGSDVSWVGELPGVAVVPFGLLLAVFVCRQGKSAGVDSNSGTMTEFRQVSAADEEAVATLIQRVIEQSVDATPEERARFVAGAGRNLGKWNGSPDGGLHVKCVAGKEIVGVILVLDFWNLCHLFVAPEHQRHGIGRALVEIAIGECTGKSPRGILRVNSTRNAVGFYERMGFSPVSQAPEPYRGLQFERALQIP